MTTPTAEGRQQCPRSLLQPAASTVPAVSSYSAWDFAALDAAVRQPLPPGRTQRIVLLTTGAMNPIHRGHVAMLESAAAQINNDEGADQQQRQGAAVVVGAFLSPSHDQYLDGKFGRKSHLSAAARLHCAAVALRDHPLVRLGAWECQREERWPDFPVVCRALQEALVARYDVQALNLRLYYVCGEDHYEKCGLSRGISSSIGVCVVARDGRSANMAGADADLVIPVRPGGGEVDVSAFSSTKVRAALGTLDRMLPPGVLEAILASRREGL